MYRYDSKAISVYLYVVTCRVFVYRLDYRGCDNTEPRTMSKSSGDGSARSAEALEVLLAETSSPRPLLRPHFWRMRPDRFCRALSTQFFGSGSADEVGREEEEDDLKCRLIAGLPQHPGG